MARYEKQLKSAVRVLLYDNSPITRVEIFLRLRRLFGRDAYNKAVAAMAAMEKSKRISERQYLSRRGNLLFAPDTPARLHARAEEAAGEAKTPPYEIRPKLHRWSKFSSDERRAIARADRAYYRTKQKIEKIREGTYRPPGRPRTTRSDSTPQGQR